MNLPKAIKILTEWREEGYIVDEAKLAEAHQLSIEALKEVDWLQCMDADFKDFMLPSETK
jgi:aryl carrier-like protein